MTEVIIRGIVSKTTASKPTYRFSIESEDIQVLRYWEQRIIHQIKESEDKLNFIPRYHDKK